MPVSFSGYHRATTFGVSGLYHNLMLFNVEPDDSRLPRKERGLGVIIGDNRRFYRLESFAGAVGAVVREDELGGVEIVLAGSKEHNFLVAYRRRLADGTLLSFQAPPTGSASGVMTDQEGNQWDLFGKATDGPRKGTRLSPVTAFMGYWFAWGAFYPGIEIFN